MKEPAFDQLLRRLAEADVEFVVVGGLALASLGTPFSIAATLAEAEQVAIETDLGRLDVVQGLDGVPGFEELRPRPPKPRSSGRRFGSAHAMT